MNSDLSFPTCYAAWVNMMHVAGVNGRDAVLPGHNVRANEFTSANRDTSPNADTEYWSMQRNLTTQSVRWFMIEIGRCMRCELIGWELDDRNDDVLGKDNDLIWCNAMRCENGRVMYRYIHLVVSRLLFLVSCDFLILVDLQYAKRQLDHCIDVSFMPSKSASSHQVFIELTFCDRIDRESASDSSIMMQRLTWCSLSRSSIWPRHRWTWSKRMTAQERPRDKVWSNVVW